ncbi:uncharacterized protein LOC127869222 [Dreissena polymorpha]|uniref:Mab-21-like HhH/H2TH-like domain-containing protein n=1 Tax=Dreissena polymorpha TaxID=45954 RepID=A0A9D4MFI5_DREPO|nr:uncharacterized protein LOC127869222 [Dreissena polymorpha]KAH3874437.1 hypothetical protein DPMN_037681 [Dreissena polymorpha]
MHCTELARLRAGYHTGSKRRTQGEWQAVHCNGQWAETNIITGSKAEGLTSFLEIDRDEMFLLNSVICQEDDVHTYIYPREIKVLRSCNRMSYHGHCRLLLERRGTMIHPNVDDAFCDDGYGREILSSDLYVNNWSNVHLSAKTVRHDHAGPSTPTTILGAVHTDTVCALRYHCPNILSKWATRPRHWPPPEVVQKVVSLGAFLTPVGFKGSEYQHVEWRVCFNAGEIELVNNLNEIQIKLYVLLKMVKKDVLNPRKKEVSSYTLKNIVLWITENNPQSLFHERSLLYWLHEGLDELRCGLGTRELPYYMILDRNMMAACGLEEAQQRTWISTISEMMYGGPRMLLRLTKIRQALIGHPEPFQWYNRRRMELEILNLIEMNRMFGCIDENGVFRDKDVTMQSLKRRRNEILREVILMMIMEWSLVYNVDNVYERILV